MEKSKPHFALARLQELIRLGKVAVSDSATTGAALLGIDYNMIVQTALALSNLNCYKSMTTYRSHKDWQDVYKICVNENNIYLKFMIKEDVLIVSFKEDTSKR